MMTKADPWKDIKPPAGAAAVNGFPVTEDGKWSFYWMVDSERRRLLGLKHSANVVSASKLPKLQGIEVEDVSGLDNQRLLVFRLLESTNKEIFQRLCEDIISTTSQADTEQDAVDAALLRTWHWHRLLKGGSSGKLTDEEQKGLIGEARVLLDHVAPNMPISDALEAWTGPSGAPKDFEIGTVAVEAKSRRGGAQPHVRISSEFQLDDQGFEKLFLHVVDLVRPGPDDEGFSLTQMVSELRALVATRDISVLDLLESRLSSVGYRDDHDYSESLWMHVGSSVFLVENEFPRITAHGVGPGVMQLTYAISLPECDEFMVEGDSLDEAIAGHSDGN